MTGRVLLLSPPRGLGGGIERYVKTLARAFAAEGVACQRLDLSGPGPRAHVRLLAQGLAALRADPEPARLVIAHRTLLPVAALPARDSAYVEELTGVAPSDELVEALTRPWMACSRIRPGWR